MTIGDDTDGWGDGVDYSGLMFLQPTNIMTEGEDEELDYDHTLEQSRGVVDRLWVLLDNQSTVNVFFNGQLLRNIHTVNRKLTIFLPVKNLSRTKLAIFQVSARFDTIRAV